MNRVRFPPFRSRRFWKFKRLKRISLQAASGLLFLLQTLLIAVEHSILSK
jgi:hypothetical protein